MIFYSKFVVAWWTRCTRVNAIVICLPSHYITANISNVKNIDRIIKRKHLASILSIFLQRYALFILLNLLRDSILKYRIKRTIFCIIIYFWTIKIGFKDCYDNDGWGYFWVGKSIYEGVISWKQPFHVIHALRTGLKHFWKHNKYTLIR